MTKTEQYNNDITNLKSRFSVINKMFHKLININFSIIIVGGALTILSGGSTIVFLSLTSLFATALIPTGFVYLEKLRTERKIGKKINLITKELSKKEKKKNTEISSNDLKQTSLIQNDIKTLNQVRDKLIEPKHITDNFEKTKK